MKKTRTFVAVEIAPDVRSRITELITRLRSSDAKVNWVAPENLHLTLKFLGDQTDEEVATVCQAVQQAATTVPAFAFHCRGVGAFPNMERPRTLWMGVRDGTDALRQLQQAIDQQLARHRYPSERRGFQPHLTFGRVRSGGAAMGELAELLAKAQDMDGGVSIVDEVLVFASYLQRGGPQYEVLATAPLA